MENKKIAIIILGKPNSGKSNTWYEIFNRVIRSGYKKLTISEKEYNVYVKNSSFEETNKEISLKIFVRNASFEEYGDEISTYKKFKGLPNIVFCSVQYIEKGLKTIEWFKENNYYLYIQWLNPGFTHQKEYNDNLKFKKSFENYGEFHKISGKEKTIRTNLIKEFLFNWFKNKK